MKRIAHLILIPLCLSLAGCSSLPQVADDAVAPDYGSVVVHDPSIMAASNGQYYIVGSHMAGGYSKDLVHWEQHGASVANQMFFEDIHELDDVMAWGHTRTFWAGCHIELKSGPYKGKYMMDYCVCQGSCPQAAIGYAIADKPEGPYKDMGVLLYSFGSRTMEDTYDEETLAMLKAGESGNTEAWVEIEAPDGSLVNYNSNFCPNAIDPCTFYAPDGQLWLLYGSYSGGIFVLKLNDDGTILREEGQSYYGTRIMGNFHSAIEGPFIMYSPETEYYYLFTSYGGLNARGGYNVRVARSKTPDGEYLDPAGNSMLDCKGTPGVTMLRQNKAIEPFGLKLMGNFEFLPAEGETESSEIYMSPGHNSALYDEATGRYFNIFHTRFGGMGEKYEIRVHQMFMNEDGWPVVTPHRFSGDLKYSFSKADLEGDYKFIDHGTTISGQVTQSSIISLNADGTVSGAAEGTWKFSKSGKLWYCTITLADVEYKGVFHYQYDPAVKKNRVTFTACSNLNNTIWGSKVEIK